MSLLKQGTGGGRNSKARSDARVPKVPNPMGAARRAGNGIAPRHIEPAPKAKAGLPGLAGFARTDAYARTKKGAAPAAPQPESPKFEPQAHPVVEPEEMVAQPAPVEAEEPFESADADNLADYAAFADAAPSEEQPQQEDGWSFASQAAAGAGEEFALEAGEDEAAEDQFGAGEADVEAAGEADDDFSGFSLDSLERYLAGGGPLPAEEETPEQPRDEDAYSTEAYPSDAFPSETFPPQGAYDEEHPPAPPDEAGEETGAGELPVGELQAFEAQYDQHPEIPLGDFEPEGGEAPREDAYFTTEPAVDADFLDSAAAPGEGKEKRGKRTLVVASALIGSLALGGALAFAYKNSGAIIGGSGEPPLIQADGRPVKQAPDEPGGKQFPHKNKLIYDRLAGEGAAEDEKIVPRQEEVATAAQQQAAPEGGDAQTASDGETAAPGLAVEGPKKVKTLVVSPDGTVMEPQIPPAQALAVPSVPQVPQVPQVPGAPGSATTSSQAAAPATPAPAPARKPAAPTRTATAPAPQPPVAAASGGQYVVQVAARKSQTDALAAFADLQQKYPSLLSDYRPLIERADLGSKGVWYRLRVGPLNQKTSAATLCQKLKSAGMSSCLVRPYSGS